MASVLDDWVLILRYCDIGTRPAASSNNQMFLGKYPITYNIEIPLWYAY